MPHTRRLTVVDINDDAQNGTDSVTRSLVDVVPIQDDRTVQQLLAEIRAGRSLRPDVFTIDINLCQSPRYRDLSSFTWATADSTVRPLGPLLALPFLAQNECTVFRLYSSYWSDAAVLRNPFVLLALAILASSADGQIHSITDVKSELERGCAGDFAQMFVRALSEGVRAYRERLKDPAANGLIVFDLRDTCERLAAVEETLSARSDLPLSDGQGPIAVRVSWGGVRLDCIELSSLFADLFLNVHLTDRERITRISHELRSLPAIPSDKTAYTVATEALRYIDENDVEPGKHISHVIERLLRGKTHLNSEFVMRLAVEFAWVKAWQLKDATEKERQRCVRTYLGLDGDASATNKYVLLIAKTLYWDNENHKPGFDAKKFPWRMPLSADWKNGRTDAYELKRNERGRLTAEEVLYCRMFALEELGWDGSEFPYPAWMQSALAQ